VLLLSFHPKQTEPTGVETRIKVQINGAWNLNHSAVNHKYIISCPRNHCRNIAGESLLTNYAVWTKAIRGFDLLECNFQRQDQQGLRGMIIVIPVEIPPLTRFPIQSCSLELGGYSFNLDGWIRGMNGKGREIFRPPSDSAGKGLL